MEAGQLELVGANWFLRGFGGMVNVLERMAVDGHVLNDHQLTDLGRTVHRLKVVLEAFHARRRADSQ